MLARSVLKKIMMALNDGEIARMRKLFENDERLLRCFDSVRREYLFEKNPHTPEEVEKFIKEETMLDNASNDTYYRLLKAFLEKTDMTLSALGKKLGMSKSEWSKYLGYFGAEVKNSQKAVDTTKQHRMLLKMCIYLELDIDEATIFLASAGHGFGNDFTDRLIEQCVKLKKYDTDMIDYILYDANMELLFWIEPEEDDEE